MRRTTSRARQFSRFRLLALLTLLTISLRVGSASGQIQRSGGGRIPGGPPNSRQDPDAIYTPPPESSAPLKAEITIVPVRVVVRDAQGHAITNLRKEDFKLQQDGKRQDIANFAAEMAPPVYPLTSAVISNAQPKPGEPIQPAFVPPSRFVAFFFDDVHLDTQNLIRVRDAAAHVLDSSLLPSDRVAVLTASGQSQVDFTDDRAKLHATLLTLLTHPGSAGETSSAECPPMDFFEADAIQNQNDSQAFGIATQDALNCAFDGMPTFRP